MWQAQPCAVARRCSSSTSLDLPMPGSPRITTVVPAPVSRTLSSTPASCRSSACLPTSGRRSPVPCRKDTMRYTRTSSSKPLTRLLAQILGGNAVRHTAIDGLRYQRIAGLRERIQPSGEVHSVAGDRVLGGSATREHGSHHFAAGHADVQLQRVCKRVAQLRGARVQVESGAHRPLRVVAVGDRGPEHREHAVAGVVDNAAPVGGDSAIGERVEAVQQRLHVLRIHAGAQRGIAGDIGEQNGGLPALAGRRRCCRDSGVRRLGIGRSGCGMGALRAELGLVGKRAPAATAGARQRSGALFAELWRWRGSRGYSGDISFDCMVRHTRAPHGSRTRLAILGD